MEDLNLSTGYLDKAKNISCKLKICGKTENKIKLRINFHSYEDSHKKFGILDDTKFEIDEVLLNSIIKIFNLEKLSSLYMLLIKSFDKSAVLEKNYHFSININKNNEIEKILSDDNPLLDVLFMGPVNIKPLRKYQKDGIEWLTKNNVAILADDMGLGKTVQAIKALDQHFRDGELSKCIIVCPVSLIKNWENELQKWAPHLYHNRFTSKTTDTELIKLLANSHVLITNYENLRNEHKFLKNYDFDIMILDEAHRIRKFSSQVSKEVFKFKKNKLWALTGTPIENNISDFLTLIGHLTGNEINKTEKNRSLLYLQEQLKPYVLRRLKSQVLKELPPVSEIDFPVELEEFQRESYNLVWDKRQEILSQEGSYFSVLSKLREICDGDVQYDQNSKAKIVGELVKNIKENNKKVIIFSYYLKPLEAVAGYLKSQKIDFVKFFNVDTLEREIGIQEFKDNKDKVAFVASSRIASEGLTLTEANNVIFLNRWWNPHQIIKQEIVLLE